MKLGILMDPLHKIKPYKDSTIAMIQSAQKLGWDCAFFTAESVFCRDGQAFAQVAKLTLAKDLHSNGWAQVKDLGIQPLTNFNIILMRKDPPFDMNYIHCTYALDLAMEQGVLVANRPNTLRDANEKFFILHFPQCTAPTMVTANITHLKEFWVNHKEVIYKPLDGMGGKEIFYVSEKGENLSVILEMLTQNATTMIMAQRYIPAITSSGDKRILIIDGEPVPFALARMPALGEIRGNLAAGAQGVIVALTDRDRWICEQLKATFKQKGIYFAGIDVIGDYLTEINITSPTCIREIAAYTETDLAGEFLISLAEKI
jgi:glutathione synthase